MALERLPIDEVLPELKRAWAEHASLILVAEPGAGKTTRVPPFLLAQGLVPANKKILLLQPRRLAARAVATRMAEEQGPELGWQLGREVGYQVRFENRFNASTRLLVMTEGILNRRLLNSPDLEDVGCVILDEFHERSLHTDLGLALLKEIQGALNPDLKILVMSATLETSKLESYLPNSKVLRSGGRSYPVQVLRSAEMGPRDRTPDLATQVERAVGDFLRTDDDGGHFLIFLPGVGEIRRVGDRLGGLPTLRNFEILELHGSLPLQEQTRVLAKSAKRRVILSTNIAETSLTVPGVTRVVDSGLARVLRFDPARGFDCLEVTRISRASATQRAGRAGRLGPGKVFQLWTTEENARLRDFEDPEIRRVNLSATLLTLAAWGVRDFRAFDWFESPKAAQLESAEVELRTLGALDGEGRLTKLGERLRELPLSPRFGVALLTAAESGDAARVARALALMEEKDPVFDLARLRGRVASERECDLELRLKALEMVEAGRDARDFGMEGAGVKRVLQVAEDLERTVGGARARAEQRPLVEGLWPAFSDRLARRRGEGAEKARLVGGRGVLIANDSDVRRSEFFLALDLLDTGAKAESRVRLASGLGLEEVKRLAGPEVREEFRIELDEDFRPRAERAVFFRDLAIEGPYPASFDAGLRERSEKLLSEALLRAWPRFVDKHPPLASYLRRRAFVVRHLPEAGLGEIEESTLLEWTEALASGGNVSGHPWEILSGLIPRAERELVEREAPARQLVPSGREMSLEYGEDLATVTCSVKLQELFGLAESPTILGGKVALVMELLSPGQQPVQVTRDLASFWRTGYAEVRKEMKIRYPRHPWPEDPWTAQATHRPKPRGT